MQGSQSAALLLSAKSAPADRTRQPQPYHRSWRRAHEQARINAFVANALPAGAVKWARASML